jgi:serine/threonine-protein kinase
LSTVRDLGRYRVDATIGSGGMATVFRGHDRELGRPVAIKLLADNLAADPAFRDRFHREAQMAARLSHPNIVHVYDITRDDDGRPYIVMEYVGGESLAETLAREGPTPPERVREIALDCCAGLAYAHAAGLVHRDIKPHNLLAGPDGRVKIADFGIAHSLDGVAITKTGTVLGTAGYLSPEQSRGGAVTPATDMYALGVTLHQLLTGRVPDGEPARGVPQPFRRAIARCIDPDPANRPSARDLALELAGRSAPARTKILAPKPGATVYPPRLTVLARPRLLIAATLALLVIGIGALVATAGVGGGGGAAPPPPATAQHSSPRPNAGPALGATPADEASNLARWLRRHSL